MNIKTTTIQETDIKGWVDSANRIGTALVLDIMDGLGRRQQALDMGIEPRASQRTVIGSAKTLLWMDFAHEDQSTYELELKAVDSLLPHEVVVCATANSGRSGIWGELLTTAAMRRGAAGVVTDGAVRDIAQMQGMGFPVYSRFLSPYDSFNRQKVVAYDVMVEIDGVTIRPADVIVADLDGVAIVPQEIAPDILRLALEKADREDRFRDAVRNGSSLTEAYQKYNVL
ncbi:RraA family protein [Phyllobacterium sp. SB3]|uniref:RraA family protein n=1 Tax=Phyllobacterium sp. SB3 TaxID=3156073 RepID=UPI0032AED392